jgi:uncharacterized protein (TIGR03437 family)
MMANLGRIGVVVGIGLLCSTYGFGYYHFVHYLNSSGPYRQVPERFDLNALPERTVQYVISDQGPTSFAPGDSFTALISQIRLAAQSWNQVATSELRLTFGGMSTPGATHNTPVVEVLFDDIPPGLLAYGGPTVRAEPSSTGDQFVPILRSTLVLPRDLAQRPSWSEGFFLMAAHEFGHTVGLQHSMASSLMATERTRGTTKAKPLAPDDMAAISLLYPVSGYTTSTGSITGTVRFGSDGVNLASVVALSPQGTAVNAITNPDGTYRISGLSAGSYYVYAHPLPPALAGETYPANIVPPLGPENFYLTASPAFDTVFYPGVKSAGDASFVFVQRNGTAEGIDFNVQRRPSPAVHTVQTYSFPGQIAVKPAHLVFGGNRNSVYATGVGLTADAGVSVLGGAATLAALRPYSQDPRFVQMDFQLDLISGFSGEGARHLTIAADDDLYVLPSAFRVVRKQPPQISAVARAFDGNGQVQAVISGNNLAADTRILFDGVPGIVTGFDEGSGDLSVTPPPGPYGHRAAVVALNVDGQSSLFLQGTPPGFEYDFGDLGSVSLQPSQLSPGTQRMIELIGGNTNFAPGATLSFGTSDVIVKQVWVTSPTRMIANVVVSESGVPGALKATVTNGIRVYTTNYTLESPLSASAGPPVRLSGSIADSTSGRATVPAGRVAAVQVEGATSGDSVQVSVAGVTATVVSLLEGRLLFRIPADLPPGPAVVRISIGGNALPPLAMEIDQPLPEIVAVTASATRISATRPATPGERLLISVRGLAESRSHISGDRVTVRVGQRPHPVLTVDSDETLHQVYIVLDSGTSSGQQALTVSIDGRESQPFTLLVR